ncbi:MAG TPA: hypothetical protein VHR47_11385, partial [Bacillota bacterium]|nr:hypothetical protein [Bacillota bacterium]
RSEDNEKPLIYGHPTPWTSFTTVRIDGKDYVFGGPTTRRAGADGQTGRVISSPHRDGSELVTIFDINGIQVEQRLALSNNPYSGYEDTVRIRYRLTNLTQTEKIVGTRVVLDTMLGTNDGAPFQVGGKSINTQTPLTQNELPDVWQAFDSLSSPTVIAQGIFRGYGATPPDAAVFTDWGTAADNLWELPLVEGQDFTRSGEEDPDTAIALYWKDQPLAPQATREVTILYGLGGVTMAPGASFLGIAAPSEMIYDPKSAQVYQVLTYIENHTERIAKNVHVKLNLPPGLVFADGQHSWNIAKMEPKEIRQLLWSIKADGNAFGPVEIELNVTGEDLTANTLKRSIRILGPPVLQSTLIQPDLSNWQGGPFKLAATVKNNGGSTARDLWVSLDTMNGLRLADGETQRKYLLDLAPGETTPVYWWVVPDKPGNAKAALTVTHQSGHGELANITLNVPSLSGRVYLNSAQEVAVGEAFCIEVVAEKLNNIDGFSLDFHYDPSYFKVIRVAKSRFSSNGDANWNEGKIDNNKGFVRSISVQRSSPVNENKFAMVRFFLIPLRAGDSPLMVENCRIHTIANTNLSLKTDQLIIKIKEAKS